MRVFLALIFSILLLFPAPASAALLTGSYLLQMCEMKPDGSEVTKGGHAVCQAYISGVLDYHRFLQSLDVAPSIKICIPPKTTLYQVQKVVLGYLRKNAQHDDFIASLAVATAINQRYPCR